MATALASVLPKPQHPLPSTNGARTADRAGDGGASTKVAAAGPPPYRHRKGFVPRAPEDFSGGGAFPEILVAQYPLDMGRKKSKGVGNTVALQTDVQGNVLYDALAKHGHSDKTIVKSQFKDLVPLHERADAGNLDFSRPSATEVAETTERTRAALEKVVSGKIAAAKPKTLSAATTNNKAPQYIRYTPAQQGEGFNSGAAQRIIRMVDAPVDPLDPPKFKHKRVPRGPPSPPAPVLHSPPRKVSAKEQAEWVIPPCISNWKNAKGYTIPLDKRLAADGRGLQEVQINDNFAKFTEALYAADRHAREEVRQRNLMQQKLAAKEKAAKEENLRMLAQRAREERAGFAVSDYSDDDTGKRKEENLRMLAQRAREERAGFAVSDYSDDDTSKRKEAQEEMECRRRERDEVRRDRQKQREREIRMSRMGNEAKSRYAAREADRSVSEKIALGIAKPTLSKDSMFDQRLFNQTEGISSGFKDDEAYAVYDEALFSAQATSSAIYRPKRSGGGDVEHGLGDEEAVNKLLSNDRFGGSGLAVKRGFQGADASVAVRRDGPVQFEKEVDDPFGHDEFLNQAKKGKRSRNK